MHWMKNIPVMLSAFAAIFVITAGAIAVDRHYNGRFATIETVDLVAMRLDKKIIRDNLKDLQGQIRAIRIKWGDDMSLYPDYIKELYLKIIDAIKLEEKELNGG